MGETRSAAWPTTMRDLADGERLIVSSFRRWIGGWAQDPVHWKILSHDFSTSFGGAAGRGALASFGRLVHILRLNACRTIHYHQPCCPCLGVNEACLLTIVAACQNGDGTLARSASGWLVVDDAVGDLLSAAALLAQAMRQHGMPLPKRWRGPSLVVSEGDELPTVRAALH